jgi:hypothetical protein
MAVIEKMRWVKSGCSIGCMLALAGVIFAAEVDDQARWWSHVEYLASDRLEGRNTGSAGYRLAAEYVVKQFERMGLKPAGDKGFSQSVEFNTRLLDETRSSLSLVRGGQPDAQPEAMTLGEQAIINAGVDPAPAVEADLVFIGYGLRSPESNFDDFAGLETRGKIAVFIGGAPSSMSAELAAHYQSAGQRWINLKSAGIIGAVSIQNPHHMDIPWPRVASNRFQTTMQLAAPGMNETEGQQIAVTWNPAHADLLFAGSGHNFNELVELAEAGKPLPRFALPVRLVAKTAVKRDKVHSENVAAIYPGADPKLMSEYVVMSAHLDHLGIGQPINGDSIFNGAMDNAAGVASVLEVAAHLSEAKVKTRRSILFLLVTGEEKGLLGSRYYATHPPVPKQNIVANINADMYLPLYPLKMLTVYGLAESSLGDDFRVVAKQMEVQIQSDPEPVRRVFVRSDQYSFVREGTPSILLKFGNEKGSPEFDIEKKWLSERYHAPSDDLNQPVDKKAAVTFNQLVGRVIERVANADARPAWTSTSFFRRFAQN